MAYGIVSIISYMIFLIWVIASSPKGNADWVPVGTNLYSFGATMSLAYAIQAFFIPVLMKNPLKSKHVFLTLMSYVIGACAYAFICVVGSVGIMNRTALTKDPQTIEDYFKIGNV
jgi:nitrate reductase gamma subunit